MDAAELQHGYAVLTNTFVEWSIKHSVFSPTGSRNLAAVKLQARRFEEHLDERVKATQAWVRYTLAKSRAKTAKTTVERRKALAAEIEAKSKFQLDSNLQYLQYWTLKFHSISPKDPRHLWVKMIRAQYASAKARNREALLGIAYGKAIAKGLVEQRVSASEAYERSVIDSRIRALDILKLQYDFRISNDKGFTGKKHITMLRARRQKIQGEISDLKKQLKLLPRSR